MKRTQGKPFSFFFTYGIILAGIIFLLASAGCQTTPPPKPYQAPPEAPRESGRPYVFYTAVEMAEAIRNGEVTSEELVRAHLNHIYLHNPDLNAIVTIDADNALRHAAEADEAFSRGEIRGPLHGVPVTIKDHFAVRNMRTTNAHPDMKDQVTLFDATVVGRLKDAGAIVIGKTNLPYLAMDLQTRNDVFGKTSNPWDPDRTPGGSGGGGAAAVAAGMSPVDIGSDMGGSLRIPAHFTGIYSFKPTENVVSHHGSFPGLFNPDRRAVRHMASIGPAARSVRDLELVMDIIAGPDGKDATVIPVDRPSEHGGPDLDSLRIAWSDQFGNVPVTGDTREAMEKFVKKLSDAGINVVRIDPDYDFQAVWKNWGELNDIQLMYNQPGYIRLFSFVFGWSYRARSPLMQMVYPMSVTKNVEVLSRRDQLITSFDRFMGEWDAFICPAAALPAIKHRPPDAVRLDMPVYTRPLQVDDKQLNYWTAMGAYATPFNVTGNPVVTIPAGYSEAGLPVGVQIVGGRWQDFELLEIAKRIDEVAGAYREPDGF